MCVYADCSNNKKGNQAFFNEVIDPENRETIIYNVQQILSCLWQSRHRVALLAAYLTLLFQQKKKFMLSQDTEVFDDLTDLMNKKLFSDKAKAMKIGTNPIKTANTKQPEECRIILYQLLCTYLKNFTEVNFDQECCDAIIQTTSLCFDQLLYKVEKETVAQLIDEGNFFNVKSLVKSDHWLHPVLQEIHPRMECQANFKPERLPKLLKKTYLKTNASASDKIKEFIRKPKHSKEVDVLFDQYTQLLFHGQYKLRGREMHYDGLKELALLMEEIMKKADIILPTNTQEIDTEERNRILETVQTEIHTLFAKRIEKEHYAKSMSFLLVYLYSSSFIQSELPFNLSSYGKI